MVEQVDKIKAKELIKGGIKILDVRTEFEHGQNNIPNSLLIPLSSNFEQDVGELDKEKSILVYCRIGNRSLYAAKIMEKIGFEKVYNLQNGILDFD